MSVQCVQIYKKKPTALSHKESSVLSCLDDRACDNLWEVPYVLLL